MEQYVHPDVETASESDEELVELAVMPVEGEVDSVIDEVTERSGTYEEEALGTLRVHIPPEEAEAFATLSCIQSVTPADLTMGDLSEGNLNTLTE